MAKRAPHSIAFLLGTSITFALTRAVVGCASDAGGIHGGDFGSLPELDGGRRQLPDGGILEPDGAVVAPDDDDDTNDSSTEPVCNGTGTAAVLAGGTSALTGAVKVAGSRWLGTTITGSGTGATSKPSLVAFNGGFIGATQGSDSTLQAVTYANTWSAQAIGVGTVKGSPTLAVAGGDVHIAYSGGNGANTDYMHGIYDGTSSSWNAASELVGTAGPPAEHSFGTVSAGLAGEPDGSLVFVENGSDNGLYARTWTSAAGWIKSIPVQGAGSVGQHGATPEVLPVTGAFDAILIYADNNTPSAGGAPIAWASHTVGSATWGTPNQPPNEISGAATTEKMASAALTSTSLVLSFRSGGNAYYTVGLVGSSGVTWSPVAPVGGGTPIPVLSVAAVAKGICGADMIFAYALMDGTIQTVSLTGTTWSTPETINKTAGSYVAIATMP